MLKARNKKISLILVLAMVMTMFAGIGTASAASLNNIDRVLTVADDTTPTLGTITIKQDSDFPWTNPGTFRLILPNGVKWQTSTVTALGGTATGSAVSDQILEIEMANMVSSVSIEPKVKISSGFSGPVEMTIDAMDSIVTPGKMVIANVSGGKMAATVLKTEKIGKYGNAGSIEVIENTPGAAGAVATFTFRLPTNFKWGNTTPSNAIKYGGAFANATTKNAIIDSSTDGKVFKVQLQGIPNNQGRGYLVLDSPIIKADRNAAFGDIEVEVVGERNLLSDGKTSDNTTLVDTDLVIAEYVDWGVDVSVKEVKELKAGKFNQKTAKITIEENVPGTVIAGRDDIVIEFPNSVKVTGAKISNSDFCATNALNNLSGEDSYVEIPVKANLDSSKTNKIELELELSIKPILTAKDMDITATVSGAGIDTQELVVAKAIAPVSIAGVPAEAKIGVQKQKINDIVITENVKGAIEANWVAGNVPGGYMVVKLDQGVEWAQKPTIEVTEGNLELDTAGADFDGTELKIPVKYASTKPSTVTISDVYVTVDRTVPEGLIKVFLAGPAVLDNYYKYTAGWANYGTNIMNDKTTWVGKLGKSETLDAGQFDTKVNAVGAAVNVVTPAPGDVANVAVFNYGQTSYLLNGVPTQMDVAPYAKNNRTYVPVRYCANALGISDNNIIWDQQAKTVTMMKGDKVVQLKLGSNIMTINGVDIRMDVAVEAQNNRTFLPAAWVAQAFGAKAVWDPANPNTVVVSY